MGEIVNHFTYIHARCKSPNNPTSNIVVIILNDIKVHSYRDTKCKIEF